MAHIQRLPTALINQIAAGEVIERPASVVKELLENSVDAGAKHVRVEIEQGGRRLIRVLDDGAGIAAEDLPLAFASHATSKIHAAEDLDRIASMGFRGEALASIGAVSQARIVSRPPSETAGAEVAAVGGDIGPTAPAGAPPGTLVEVRNLFYNAPVRARFLKKTATEFGHIAEMATRIALANAAIHFTLVHNGTTVLDLPAVDDLRERLAAVFGRDLVEHLGRVELVEHDVAIEGYVAPPYENRAGTQMQYVFLNGRFIRDRTVAHALREAYRGHLEGGRQPIAFLYLSLDPRAFDVNVHPMKLEVRFADPQRIHHLVHTTVRRWLLGTDTLKPLESARADASDTAPAGEQPNVPGAAAPPPGPVSPLPQSAAAPPNPGVGQRIERVREVIADYLRHLPPATRPGPGNHTTRPSSRLPAPPPVIPRGKIPVEHQPRLDEVLAPAGQPGPARAAGRCLQLLDTYIVAAVDDGLLIIDQHALHERLLHDRIRHRLDQAPLETQRLLVPVIVDLSPAELAILPAAQWAFARLGIELEGFGGTTVALRAFPLLLGRADPASVVHDLLAAAAAGDFPDQAALLTHLANVMACHAAVRAGQPLAESEMRDLVDAVTGLGDRDTCPHGRPTVLRFSRADLERQFRRT
jgi:DNA mismatch repair protein MutL